MSKFKEGDKVRFTVDYGGAKKGDLATVRRTDGQFVYVRGASGINYTAFPERFELVQTTGTTLPNARKTWIISVIIDGKLAPAPRPAEYVSAEQARAVARSMAEKNPGSTFVVFEAVGAAYVAPAPKADFVTL
jgi:hypothetical protein